MTITNNIQCPQCTKSFSPDEQGTAMQLCRGNHLFCNTCVTELFEKTLPRSPTCPVCCTKPVINQSISFTPLYPAVGPTKSASQVASAILCTASASCPDYLNLSFAVPSKALMEARKPERKTLSPIELKAWKLLTEGIETQFTTNVFSNADLSELKKTKAATYEEVIRLFYDHVRALLWELPEHLSAELQMTSPLLIEERFHLIKLLSDESFTDPEDPTKLTIERYFRIHPNVKEFHNAFNSVKYFQLLTTCLSQYKAKNPEMEYTVAYCYEHGWGIEKNLKLAKKYYKIASKNGHSDATIKYVLLACSDIKDNKQIIKKLKALLKKHDSIVVKYKLGHLLLNSKDGKSHARAAELLKEANSAGLLSDSQIICRNRDS